MLLVGFISFGVGFACGLLVMSSRTDDPDEQLKA